MIDSNGGMLSEALSKRDEKIVLIQDSCPNYAKINHFEDDAAPEKGPDEAVLTPTKKQTQSATSLNE